MSDELATFPVTSIPPDAMRIQVPAADGPTTPFSGLESATTELPGIDIWPCEAGALDVGWNDAVAVTSPHDNSSTDTRSTEFVIPVEAPSSCKKYHPAALCFDPPPRTLLNFTGSCTADAEHVVENLDIQNSGEQCYNIRLEAGKRTNAQAFGSACTSVQDPGDKIERPPSLQQGRTQHKLSPHQQPRQYTRTIANAMALRLNNIPVDMHRQLGLGNMYPQKTSGRRKNACTVVMATSTIHVSVLMLRTTSRGQHHRRITTGWREFCARAGVEIGDELVFERVNNANKLFVQVKKKITTQSNAL